MARFLASMLVALLVLTTAHDKALACSDDVSWSGLNANRLLILNVESYCTRKAFECGIEVCIARGLENVEVSVVPWIQKDPQVPWKVVITADARESAAPDLDRACNFVTSEAKWIFGPGHIFETRFTTLDGEIRECDIAQIALAPQAPSLTSRPDGLPLALDPDVWSSAWKSSISALRSITAEIQPTLVIEQP